jgi:tripartite-type tricarboxylate transporter receptor subunit TctC
MRRPLRGFGLLIGTALMLHSTLAPAQSYPSQSVKIVAPFGAGIVDTVARLLGARLSEKWGQPVIIENKVGAGGNIGSEAVARSRGDGTTFLIGGAHLVINAVLRERVPYSLMNDLLPVTQVASLPYVIAVHPAVPARTLTELIAYGRANPGKLNFGSGGVGTGPHVSGELFKLKAKVDMVHIPLKGSGATATELLAGRIDVVIDTVTPYLQFIQRGDLRALAVTGASRIPNLPNVPTAKEAGLPDFETGSWLSLWAPAGTPPSIIHQVSKDVTAVLEAPEARAEWAKLSIVPTTSTPEQFEAFVRAEMSKWAEVVKVSGAKVN